MTSEVSSQRLLSIFLMPLVVGEKVLLFAWGQRTALASGPQAASSPGPDVNYGTSREPQAPGHLVPSSLRPFTQTALSPHTAAAGPEQRLLRARGFSWGVLASHGGNGARDISGLKNGSHLSTDTDSRNIELLHLQKQMQMVGNIPLKATAVVSWTLSQISYQPVFTFFLHQNFGCLDVPEVTEQNRIGTLGDTRHVGRREGSLSRVWRGWLSGVFISWSWQLPPPPPPPRSSLAWPFCPLPNSEALFEPQLTIPSFQSWARSFWLD